MKLSQNTIIPVLLILQFFTSFVFAQAQESLNVRVVSIMPEKGIIGGLVIRDGYIYASGWDGLKIIDVRNPRNPVKVGHYAIDDTVSLTGVRLSGKYAYVAQYRRREGGTAGMLILDISDPTQPRKVAFYPVKGQIMTIGAVARPDVNIEVAGDYVYIVDDLEEGPPPGNWGAVLRVIDVHDPSRPTEISTIKRKYLFYIQFVKNYLYVAHTGNTLEILDVSNPFEISVVTSMNFPVGYFFPDRDKLYIARMVYVSRGWAQERLTVADISDPAHPEVLSDIYISPNPTAGSLGGVSLYGRYIYYYEGSGWHPPIIHVFLSMDERLIEVGFYKEFFYLMSSFGPYIYATTEFEIYILEFMESDIVSIQPKGKLSSTWGKLKNRREK